MDDFVISANIISTLMNYNTRSNTDAHTPRIGVLRSESSKDFLRPAPPCEQTLLLIYGINPPPLTCSTWPLTKDDP
ncbi:MAG: hypothetical protein ABSC26_04480, partial [Stellaceae bacterium]